MRKVSCLRTQHYEPRLGSNRLCSFRKYHTPSVVSFWLNSSPPPPPRAVTKCLFTCSLGLHTCSKLVTVALAFTPVANLLLNMGKLYQPQASSPITSSLHQTYSAATGFMSYSPPPLHHPYRNLSFHSSVAFTILACETPLPLGNSKNPSQESITCPPWGGYGYFHAYIILIIT